MPLEVTLAVEDLNRATSALDRIAQKYQQIGQSARQIQGFNLNPPGPAGGRAPGLNISGPAARLERAREQYFQALQRGTARQIFDAQNQFRQARVNLERSQARLQPQSLGDRLTTFLRSTRFDVGGVSPLAGRAFDLIEGLGGKVTGPLIGATIGIVAAGKAAQVMAQELAGATQRISAFGQARALTGGTIGQAGYLSLFGPGATGAANALRERLASDPMAIMASRSGMQLPAWMGSQNNAQLLVQELQHLREIGRTRGPEEQLRRFRMLQLPEEFLDTLRISEPVWQRLTEAAARSAQVMGAQEQATRDLRGETLRLQTEWETLRTQAVAPMIPTAIQFQSKMSQVVVGLGQLLGTLQDPDIFPLAPTTGTPFDFLSWLQMFGNVQQQQQQAQQLQQQGQKDATDANTKAMEALAAALEKTITGGGPRAAGAIPPRLTGEMMRRAVEQRAFFGGAWAL